MLTRRTRVRLQHLPACQQRCGCVHFVFRCLSLLACTCSCSTASSQALSDCTTHCLLQQKARHKIAEALELHSGCAECPCVLRCARARHPVLGQCQGALAPRTHLCHCSEACERARARLLPNQACSFPFLRYLLNCNFAVALAHGSLLSCSSSSWGEGEGGSELCLITLSIKRSQLIHEVHCSLR